MIDDIPKRILDEVELTAGLIADHLWSIVGLTRQITEKHLADHEGLWNESEQYLKIVEETMESQKATVRNLPDQNEETMDIFFSWLTLVHNKKLTKKELEEAIFQDLIKFHKREWYL